MFLMGPRPLRNHVRGRRLKRGEQKILANQKASTRCAPVAATCRDVRLFIFFIAVINAMMSHHLITVNYCKNSMISQRQLLAFAMQSRKTEEEPSTLLPPTALRASDCRWPAFKGARCNILSVLDGAVLHWHTPNLQPPKEQTRI